jgi:hypothetical protein
MLLHCESGSGAADDGAALAASWLRAGALDSLLELNELSLSLLAEQAALRSGLPVPAARCRLCRPVALAGAARTAGG